MGIDAELYFDNIQVDWRINPELSAARAGRLTRQCAVGVTGQPFRRGGGSSTTPFYEVPLPHPQQSQL
jgi:hypothetical protein